MKNQIKHLNSRTPNTIFCVDNLSQPEQKQPPLTFPQSTIFKVEALKVLPINCKADKWNAPEAQKHLTNPLAAIRKGHLSLLKTHLDQALRDDIDIASPTSSGRSFQILVIISL